MTFNALTSPEMSAIAINLKTLTELSREKGPISYTMPDTITYRNRENEIIGSAVYDGDSEWVFKPIPNIPPPPTF